MPWPNCADYIAAMQSLPSSMGDDELRSGDLRMNPLGMPESFVGEFSIVFRIDCRSSGTCWAVKCYTRDVAGLQFRYKRIADYLLKQQVSALVDFEWLSEGVRIGGTWYPLLKTQWIKGWSLDQFVEKQVDDSSTLRKLARLWLKLGAKLRNAKIAHPDLHPSNIFIARDPESGRGILKLIDYDSLYVPALAGNPAREIGHPSFQHPRLNLEQHYGNDVDRFSHLAIYTTLRCLAVGGRRLWERFGSSDGFLFRRADLLHPERSEVMQTLWGLPDKDVHSLVGHLILAAHGLPEEVPTLDQVVPGGKVRPISASSEQRIERAFQSIWRSPYEAPIDARNPAFVILVAGQSTGGSEDQSMPNRVVQSMNDLLLQLSLQCSKGQTVIDRFQVGVITYGEKVTSGFSGVLKERWTASISEVANNPLRIESRTRQVVDGCGGAIETTVKRPVWVDPPQGAQTECRMVQALEVATELATEFAAEHPESFPPMILHFVVGAATDGDPYSAAIELRQCATNDGNSLLFTAVNDASAEFLMFPASGDRVPARTMDYFRMSSPIPTTMGKRLATIQESATEANARGFVLNSSLVPLVQSLEIGTRVGRVEREDPPSRLVFISAKSEDYDFARPLFEFLRERGVEVFLSCESLHELSVSDYRHVIDQKLDDARHMIVVTSCARNVRSSWVEAEWGLFINEKRSDRKTGNIITFIAGEMPIDDLPASLRNYEVIPASPDAFEKAYRYVCD